MNDLVKLIVVGGGRGFFDLIATSLRESCISAVPRRVETVDGIESAAEVHRATVLVFEAESCVDFKGIVKAARSTLPPLGVIAAGLRYDFNWLRGARRAGVHAFVSLAEPAALEIAIPDAIREARSVAGASAWSAITAENSILPALRRLRADLNLADSRLRKATSTLASRGWRAADPRVLAGEVGCACAQLENVEERICALEARFEGPHSLRGQQEATRTAAAVIPSPHAGSVSTFISAASPGHNLTRPLSRRP